MSLNSPLLLPEVPVRLDVTAETFQSDILLQNRPVLMKGLVSHWQAVGVARSGDTDLYSYLSQMDNGRPTSVMESRANIRGQFFYSPDMQDFNFNRYNRTVSAGLKQLMTAAEHPNPPAIYIQSTPTHDHLPRFSLENPMPVLPPQIGPRIWIGNSTRAQTHNDHDDNIACVVAGRRRFILFPPDQVKNLYIGPMDHTPSGRAISLASLEEPDFERFPRLKAALDVAQVADMEPGDALFIPKYWWHHVRATGPLNVLVNYWWGGAPENLRNPMAPFLAGLLSLKDLPIAERDYWKAMFDHYIFQTDGDPVAHIAPQVRGGLGKPTPRSYAALSAELKRLSHNS